MPSTSHRAWWAVALVCAWLPGAVGCGGEPAQPNLLLITVDTLRPDRLACYGGPPDVGTAICSLGDAGVRYVWAFSAAPSTAPAIASVLTSQYPSQHGVTQFAATTLADEAQTVAESLSAAGYATAAFVSNPVLNRGRNLHQGFDLYDARMDRRRTDRPMLVERDADATTAAAIAWARTAPEPWFLWIHFQDPHGPYEPPGVRVSQDHDGAAGPVLALGRDHSGLGAIPIYQRLGEARRAGTYEAHYLDEIRYLDGWVGRLFAQLDKLGSPGILLTADHGEAIGEDAYWFAHGHSVGLEQIRVPLLWRAPGGGDASVVPDPVSTIDVAPTLLRAAGIDRPAGFEGDPLVAGDESGRAEPSDRAIFAEHRLRAAVIAGDRYYARDRRALDEPLPDRITGGSLAPLAPRSAQLDPDGEQSPYQAERPTAAPLEPILQRFLDGSEAPVEPSPQAGSSATEEELRALGYLE